MLSPDSDIESVTFQHAAIRGWDDIVVRRANNHVDFIQVKHTRDDNTLTFGDLVRKDKDSDQSLLGALFSGWQEIAKKHGSGILVLYTNRASGGPGTSALGVRRPALAEFTTWLVSEAQRCSRLEDFQIPSDFSDAWIEWRASFKNSTEAECLDFCRALTVVTDQPNLRDCEDGLTQQLKVTFAISDSLATSLFHALTHSLRRWTTDPAFRTVRNEDVLAAIAVVDSKDLEQCAPPPPAPFFHSRTQMAEALEAMLGQPSLAPALFLCAEPGGGKTSVLSHLINRRSSDSATAVIGLRYFAFRPITPASPIIPPDSDRYVRADRLWFGLLGQLRSQLAGRLAEYGVPIRNDFIDWPAARSHVLRLAALLAAEQGRPYVIAIDGLDHAARAVRSSKEDAVAFFDSLPSPEELHGSNVTVLLAGQPPESYPEYPPWLRTHHPLVCRIDLPGLELEDIKQLLDQPDSALPLDERAGAAQVIRDLCAGNTLESVFAACEALLCTSAEDTRHRLTDRQCRSGLQTYYENIWSHARTTIAGVPPSAMEALAAALAKCRERITAQWLTSVFAIPAMHASDWQTVLTAILPLVATDSGGVRVRHNDVRLFLHAKLASLTNDSRSNLLQLLGDSLQSTRFRSFGSSLIIAEPSGQSRPRSRLGGMLHCRVGV